MVLEVTLGRGGGGGKKNKLTTCHIPFSHKIFGGGGVFYPGTKFPQNNYKPSMDL